MDLDQWRIIKPLIVIVTKRENSLAISRLLLQLITQYCKALKATTMIIQTGMPTNSEFITNQAELFVAAQCKVICAIIHS